MPKTTGDCIFSTGDATCARCGSIEHVDQLRLEARRERSACAAVGVGQLFQIVDQPSQRDPIGAIGRQVIAADLRHAAVAPLKEAARLVDRIDHVGHLERLREEILVDEQVMMRQENPEAGMGMIPAHDVEIGKASGRARG